MKHPIPEGIEGADCDRYCEDGGMSKRRRTSSPAESKQVDNRKTGGFLILDFLSLTHFSLTVIDFSSRPLSVRKYLARDGGFKNSD